MEYLHEELTKRIISCFYEVYNQLGYGFFEKVYEHAMMIELLGMVLLLAISSRLKSIIVNS